MSRSDLPTRIGGGLALLTALQCTTDMVYIAPAVLAPLGALAAVRLARPATRRIGVRLAAAIGVAALALVPIYAGYARVAAENPALRTQTLWPAPTLPITIPGGLLSPGMPTDLPHVMAVVLALGAIGLLVRLRRGDDAPERPPGHTARCGPRSPSSRR